ncbi:MOSC domain-containing protein [Boeremia exigua]|uniref:MOSC domain-containing protein n=1 Tax=Boeremia exigua TaxID=749465 RepID=UPI001E8EC529|nr:MOSC domain-containing protein [Boeremia exigua]KAH6612156.1 MOSC domain-containing protein [Boeremia exigua]
MINKVGLEMTPRTVYTTIFVTLSPALLVLFFALFQRDRAPPPPPGCTRLGVPGRGNFEDQYSKKYAKGGDPTKEKPWTVKALFVYPLKSARPIELDNTEVLPSGLKYDRHFALAHRVTSLPSPTGKVTSEWQPLTAAKFPRMATLETALWIPDPSARGYAPDSPWVRAGGCLSIRFPFSQDTDFSLQGLRAWGKILAAQLGGRPEPMLEIRVPLDPPADRIKSTGCGTQELRVGATGVRALDLGPEVDAEMLARLKYTLGTTNPISLFRVPTAGVRDVCRPKGEKGVDSYPLTLLPLSTPHALAAALPRSQAIEEMFKFPTIDALSFRANIYVTGPPAFAEDSWTKARIGGVEVAVACPRERCEEDGEGGFRVVGEGKQGVGVLGGVVREGPIKVGDQIEVLATGTGSFVAA